MSLALIPTLSPAVPRINVLEPDTCADQIPITTIAHSLAQLTLHTGHTIRPVCVAEHALLMVEILEHQGITEPRVLMAALMADAHACVVGVASRGMQVLLGTQWASAADRWARALRAAYGLDMVYAEHGHLVWMAAQFAEAAELHDLLPEAASTGAARHFVAPEWLDLRHRDHMTWQDWRQAYVDKWDELNFAAQGGLAA